MKKALLIGLNYTDTSFSLPGCENDATDLESLMQSKNISTEKKFTVTRTEIYDFFKSCEKMKKSDTVYFCYSGHGTQVPSTTEADGFREAIVLWTTGYHTELLYDFEIKEMVSNLKCRVFVYMDSCFSGGMSRNASQVRKKFIPYNADFMNIPEITFKRNAEKPANKQCFMMASREDEYATDLGTNGAFTYGILTAIQRGKKSISTIMREATKICSEYQTPVYEMVNQKNPRFI